MNVQRLNGALLLLLAVWVGYNEWPWFSFFSQDIPIRRGAQARQPQQPAREKVASIKTSQRPPSILGSFSGTTFFQVVFFDEKTGIVCGDKSLFTEDSGISWTPLEGFTPPTLRGACFLNSQQVLG